MYATLGIEKDDDGDEDFTYDEDFARHEEREEEEAEKLPSGFVEPPKAGKTSEYVPRKRTSKHLEELESMGNQYDEVVNVVPAFGESRAFESWDDFDKAFGEYKRKNNLKFRIRSSETTERFNRYARAAIQWV
ncbi:hypothetical protein GQ600_13898 [Phytophthora cactorum]|nr:hypothetical protein GQ600_13898 [Phytophthora cactorum]